MSTRVVIICFIWAMGSACQEDATPAVLDAGHVDQSLSEQGPADSGAMADQENSAPDPLIGALCEVLRRCQDQLGMTFADSASCERYFTGRYGCGVSAGLNVGAQERCHQWLQTVTCEDPILAFGCVALAKPLDCANPLMQWGQRGAPGCAYVYQAPIAGEGASCESFPCDEGLYCQRGPTKAICPVCKPEATLGEVCLYNPILPTHLPCAPGLYCSAAKHCEPMLGDGQSCTVHRDCASGFCRDTICAKPYEAGDPIEFLALDQCRGFLVGRDATCASRRPAGEPCRFDVDCYLDGVCVQGKCQARAVCLARQAGEPCVTEPLGCAKGAFCNNTAEPQLCEAVHALGEPCEFTEDCGDDAYCSLGEQRCTAYTEAGGSCEGALLCAKQLFCDLASGEICVPQQEDGMACDYGFQCLTGYCAADNSTCAPKPACTIP